MFKYFFNEYTHTPPGGGFGVWSPEHFAVLGVITLLTAILCIVYRREDTKKRLVTLRALAIICVGSEALRQIVTLLTGQYNAGNIPVSMCNFSAYFLCIYAFTGLRQLEEFSYAVGLPGALLALISPAWANLPLANFYALYSFFMHGLVVALTLALIISGDFKPNPRYLGFTVLFIAVSAPLIGFMNTKLNTNFYFLETPAPDSPLIFISDIFGTGWRYIIGFILLVLFLWVLLYLPWIIYGALNKQKVKKRRT
jgi:hypothetical integral membrane protein (TIGR02206 family)